MIRSFLGLQRSSRVAGLYGSQLSVIRSAHQAREAHSRHPTPQDEALGLLAATTEGEAAAARLVASVSHLNNLARIQVND
jgi:hypothetical protein